MVLMQSITFQIVNKGQRQSTSNQNVYIECDTDEGKIAIWGSQDKLKNIIQIESATKTPFQLISDRYVTPSWQQHSHWIPESAIIQIK